MKKFTKIFVCLLLCVFGLSLMACKDNRTPAEKAFTYPKSSDLVTGNGGMAVQKGNYLYYVNGYKTVDSEEHTQDATYTHGALMLMKLNNDGSIVTDENGLLKDDYYITMSNRLCGFNATSLYIAGDYLYFTSPSKENTTEDSVDPVWAKDYIEFYRIKLDKTSSPERIYQADVLYSDVKFEYYSNGSNVYILVYEKGETLEKDSDKNNALVRVTGSGDVELIANNVAETGYVFAENSNEIFYVKEDESQFKLYQYDIVNNSSTYYKKAEDAAFDVNYVSGGNVYVTVDGDLQVSSIASQSGFVTACLATSDYDKVIVDNGIVIAVWDNTFNFFADDLKISKTVTDSEATEITVIGCVNGSIVYRTNDNKIKMFSYSNYLAGYSAELVTLATVEGLDTGYFDLQEDYVYFYKTVGSHTYLHRLKVANHFDETEEMVGVYLEADTPKVETEETEEE